MIELATFGIFAAIIGIPTLLISIFVTAPAWKIAGFVLLGLFALTHGINVADITWHWIARRIGR